MGLDLSVNVGVNYICVLTYTGNVLVRPKVIHAAIMGSLSSDVPLRGP